MSNLQFIVICAFAITALIGMAELLAYGHADERKACLKAGHEWSSTKYVCVAKVTK